MESRRCRERIPGSSAPYNEEVLMRAVTRTLIALAAAVPLAGRPVPAFALPSDERHEPKVGSLAQPILEVRTGPDAQTPTQPKPDPVGNGIAIGAAIGAATGLGLMRWGYAQCDGSCDAPEPMPMYLAAGSFGAAVGGVVGWLIDASRKNTSQRVAIGAYAVPKRAAVRVQVRW
jgi:hypothetical protein